MITCTRCKLNKSDDGFTKKRSGQRFKHCDKCRKQRKSRAGCGNSRKASQVKAAELASESKNKIIAADFYEFVARIKKVKHAAT